MLRERPAILEVEHVRDAFDLGGAATLIIGEFGQSLHPSDYFRVGLQQSQARNDRPDTFLCLQKRRDLLGPRQTSRAWLNNRSLRVAALFALDVIENG